MDRIFGINASNTDFSDIDIKELSDYLCCLALGIEDRADLILPDCADDDMRKFDTLSDEVMESLYYLKACAENSYNADHFRVLLRVLAKTMDYDYFLD